MPDRYIICFQVFKSKLAFIFRIGFLNYAISSSELLHSQAFWNIYNMCISLISRVTIVIIFLQKKKKKFFFNKK